jgi:hypothetical protein
MLPLSLPAPPALAGDLPKFIEFMEAGGEALI